MSVSALSSYNNYNRRIPAKPAGSKSVMPVPLSEVKDDQYVKIWNIYKNLIESPRIKNFPEFKQKLEEVIRDGKFTRAEFAKIFGNISESAWQAFTGKNQVIYGRTSNILNDLKYYLNEFSKFSQITRIPFSYFAQCKQIYIVSGSEWVKTLDSLNGMEMNRFLRLHQNDIKELIEYFTGYRLLKDVTARDIRKMNKEQKEWMVFGLIYRWNETDGKKSLVNKNYKIFEDVLVAKKAAPLFKRYLLEGKGVSGDDFKILEDFYKKIKSMKEQLNNPRLDELNPDSPEFKKLLEQHEAYNKGLLSKDQINAYLSEIFRRVDSSKSALKAPLPIQP